MYATKGSGRKSEQGRDRKFPSFQIDMMGSWRQLEAVYL
jgi:hypothetical protein